MKLFDLKTNYQNAPINVEEGAHFSFKIEGAEFPVTYEITVENEGGIVWKSGEKSYEPLTRFGGKLNPRSKYSWTVDAVDSKGKRASAAAKFETALFREFDKDAKWINPGDKFVSVRWPAQSKAFMFRKKFELKNKPEGSRLYVSGLGAFEVYINGKRVGENYLDPVFSAYDKTTYYQIFNADEYLKKGNNIVFVLLGDGFYNQTAEDGWYFQYAAWRDYSRLLFEMDVPSDGTKILSDDSWKTTREGPIVYNVIRNGESYDATLEQDYMSYDYDDKDWWKAAVCIPTGGVMKAMQMPPIKIMKTYKPKNITRTKSGAYLVDFGVNISGFAEIAMSGNRGETVALRYGEQIRDGELETFEIGKYIFNTFCQTDKYTFKGEGLEKWHARFTYHGFQWVEVTVPEGTKFDENCIKAHYIHTAFDTIGSFECSDADLNKIYEIGVRSLSNNYHGMPTDCPHREKNGWTGDIQLSAEQALINFGIETSFKKWLRDFNDVQRESGQLPAIVPTSVWGYNWGCGPAWDSALFILAYLIEIYRGDTEIYSEIYGTAKKYVEYCKYWDRDGLVLFGLGDWCAPTDFKGYKEASNELTDSTYYFLCVDILSKMAKKLGKNKEAKEYALKAESIKSAIVKKYVNLDTGDVDNNAQTALACIIYHKFVPKSVGKKIAKKLVAEIKKDGGHFVAGILGAKYIFSALSEYGYTETAYNAILNPTYPSYKHWLDMGATSMWEDWHGASSRNHHMYSDVLAWMVKYLAGLRVDEKNPGFKHFTIKPEFIPQLSFAKAEHESPFGRISVYWKKNGDKVNMEIEIPEGSCATLDINGKKVKLPGGSHRITETI